jgi:hypothetical protein
MGTPKNCFFGVPLYQSQQPALWQLHHILPNANSGVYGLQMGILTMSVTQKSGVSIIFYTFARFLSGINFI